MLNKDTSSIEYIEASLLSLIIHHNDNELFYKVHEKLSKDDFTTEFHKKIYELLTSLVIENSLTLDKNLVLSKMKQINQKKQFEDLIAINTSVDNFTYYIKQIKNNSVIKNLKSTLLEATIDLQAEDVNAEQIVSNIEDRLIDVVSNSKSDFYKPGDLVNGIMESLKSEKKGYEVSTSIPELDGYLNGLGPGYYIIAARPSMGKTELALNIAAHNIQNGVEVLMFSLEMDEVSLTKRLMANIAEVPLAGLNSGNLTEQEMARLEKKCPDIKVLPFTMDVSAGIPATQIAAKAKRFKLKHPNLKLIIIDYLQLISSNLPDSENVQLSQISKTIKNMAQSLKIPVIALSQLSRACELREDKRPRLSDLRGSGSLEQDSDIVLFLYSDAYYDLSKRNDSLAQTEIIIGKNRNGPLGTALAVNNKDIQKFYPGFYSNSVDLVSEENNQIFDTQDVF